MPTREEEAKFARWLQGEKFPKDPNAPVIPSINWERNLVGNEPNPWFKFYDVDVSPSSPKPSPTPSPSPEPEPEPVIPGPTEYKPEGFIDVMGDKAPSKSASLTPQEQQAYVQKAMRIMSTKEVIKFKEAMRKFPNADPVETALQIISENLPDFIKAEEIIIPR